MSEEAANRTQCKSCGRMVVPQSNNQCYLCGREIVETNAAGAGGKARPRSCTVARPRPGHNRRGTNLATDLEFYAGELFTKGDVRAGLRLVGELTGMVAVGGLALTALTSWLPAIGIPISGAMVAQVMRQLAQGYGRMPTEERKQVRAAVRWLQGGFDLGEHLLDR